MNATTLNIKIKEVFFKEERIFFSLEDGREIGVPLKWYPRLANASKEELLNYSISPGGYGVHWEELDEDLSAYGILDHHQKYKTQNK